MFFKLFTVTAVFMLVIQVAARPQNPPDECVLGDNSTCPEDQICRQMVACAPPPGPCNGHSVCRKRGRDEQHHG